MQLQDFLISPNLLELLAGIILFYIMPYILLVLVIDLVYYRMKKKGRLFIYSPAISLAVLLIIHVAWTVSTSALIQEYTRRMMLTIGITPLMWVCAEIIRYVKFNVSIIQLLQ